MSNDSMPAKVGSNDGLGVGSEASRPAQGYFAASLLSAAMMSDEQEGRAYRGYCPKCKNLTLAIKHRDNGLVFKGCNVCGSMVVLRDDA